MGVCSVSPLLNCKHREDSDSAFSAIHPPWAQHNDLQGKCLQWIFTGWMINHSCSTPSLHSKKTGFTLYFRVSLETVTKADTFFWLVRWNKMFFLVTVPFYKGQKNCINIFSPKIKYKKWAKLMLKSILLY